MENRAEVWGEGTPTNWVWSPVLRLCSGIPSQFLGVKSLKLPSLKQGPASASFKNCLMDKKEHTRWQEEPERTGRHLSLQGLSAIQGWPKKRFSLCCSLVDLRIQPPDPLLKSLQQSCSWEASVTRKWGIIIALLTSQVDTLESIWDIWMCV